MVSVTNPICNKSASSHYVLHIIKPDKKYARHWKWYALYQKASVKNKVTVMFFHSEIINYSYIFVKNQMNKILTVIKDHKKMCIPIWAEKATKNI